MEPDSPGLPDSPGSPTLGPAETAGGDLTLEQDLKRPAAIYKDVEAFLGEALRQLIETVPGRPIAKSAVRLMALPLAFGREAVGKAFTVRIEERGPSSRVGVAAGTMVAAMISRSLQPRTLASLGTILAIACAGWLATRGKLAPLRRRYAEQVGLARRAWEADRRAWLDGKMNRTEREAAVVRQLERLRLALIADGSEPD